MIAELIPTWLHTHRRACDYHSDPYRHPVTSLLTETHPPATLSTREYIEVRWAMLRCYATTMPPPAAPALPLPAAGPASMAAQQAPPGARNSPFSFSNDVSPPPQLPKHALARPTTHLHLDGILDALVFVLVASELVGDGVLGRFVVV